MSINHKKLNQKRTEKYQKPQEQEQFLEQFNDTLTEFEKTLYKETDIQYPFLFIIGLPRSGTTLLSQLVAHCLDVGFINNLAARFWKAPVTGIRFARSVLGDAPFKAFESHYGTTERLRDIHEFGYFWRDWLLKDSFENIKNAHLIEDQIDWTGLRTALANIQAEFRRPMVFKNIFGSYHISKLDKILKKVHWIYIERDPLDTAISILHARRKYYDDPNTWWSYVPPDYEKIIDLDYRHQIAGQIHYLKKYYRQQMENSGTEGSFTTATYEYVCQNPRAFLNNLKKQIAAKFGYTVDIVQEPPEHFKYRTYDNHTEEKERFNKLLKEFDRND